jgi:hypothetical protein
MRRCLAVLSLAGVLSCGEDLIVTPELLAGTWTLRRFDAVDVPGIVLQNDSVTTEVLSGAMTFDGDRFDLRVSYRDTRSGITTTRLAIGFGSFIIGPKTIVLVGVPPRLEPEATGPRPLDAALVVGRGIVTYRSGTTRLTFAR